MRSLTFEVHDLPPVKSEAKSMFADGHRHLGRVRKLLTAASEAAADSPTPHFGQAFLGLNLLLTAPAPPRSDATNYLGGVGDVLENKNRRSAIQSLGDLMNVALYENDRQLQDVHYRWTRGDSSSYTLTIWELDQ